MRTSAFLALLCVSSALGASQPVLRDLSDIVLSNGVVSPPFAVGVASYTAAVDSTVASIVLRCPVADHATVTVNGARLEEGAQTPALPLSPGSAGNVFTIVTGAFPVKKTYTLTVTRAALTAADRAARLAAAAGAPEQVKLALGTTAETFSVTWVTAVAAPSVVQYGTSPDALSLSATGDAAQYHSACGGARSVAYNYTSGFIHKVFLENLKPDTAYTYRLPTMLSTGTFRTLPAAAASGAAANAFGAYPFAFGALGDLGQTDDSALTVAAVAADETLRALLHAGDMSYADCDHVRWDSWGRLVDPLAKTLPWMVCPGNHEVETDLVNMETFRAYKARFAMPEAGPERDTTSAAQLLDDCTPSIYTGNYNYGNAFYSFELGPATVVVLNTYTETDAASAQYAWLQKALASVDRARTPWLLAMMHGPWYNSNQHHHNDGNTIAMRVSMEELFHTHEVNAVFAGHVHAYERSLPVYANATVAADDLETGAPVYLNVGDAGNREGHNLEYFEQPAWSAYRNGTQFGHGRVELLNDTHATWQWHRNADGAFVVADGAIIVNRNALRKQLQAASA